MNRWKLATRLGGSFAAMIALMIALFATSVWGQKRVSDSHLAVTELDARTRATADELQLASSREQNLSARLLLALGDNTEVARLKGEIENTRNVEDPLLEALGRQAGSEESKALYELAKNKLAVFRDEQAAFIDAVGDSKKKDQASLNQYFFTTVAPKSEAFSDALANFVSLQKQGAEQLAEQAAVDASKLRIVESSLTGLGLLLAMLAAWFVTLSVTRPIRQAVEIASAIAEGKLDNKIETAGRDETSKLLKSLAGMQAHLAEQIGAMQTLIDENNFIRKALDALESMVRVADYEGRVVYANRSLIKQLSVFEPGIREHNPEFSADKFVGGSIGAIYPDSEAVVARMQALDQVKRTRAPLQGRDIDFIYTPIFNEEGRQLGTVGEWIDVTDQVAIENDLLSLIGSAGAGKLDGRLTLEGKNGFLRTLSEGINGLMQVTESNLEEVAQVLSAVSNGDLTRRIDGEQQGMFARLRDDCNKTVDQLGQIVLQIKQASLAINMAAREIASGNGDLSVRTEQQAASLEETASSMEELTGTVRQNAENSRQANQLAIGASEVATKGGKVVEDVVVTMAAIDQSSRKIVDIISVIDGISFQTNILALNAAVEAARAGEQGRGFAVVASEVRSLAQRSAAAAKEVKGLIEDSVKKVDGGTRLVEQAGRTMNEIVTSIRRVTDIVGDITAASEEQRLGIEQISKAVAQMDEGTQQNAALVEEATASARSLEEQAQGLVSTVEIFRLDDHNVEVSEVSELAVVAAPSRTPALRAVSSDTPARTTRPALRRRGTPPARAAEPADATANEWTEF